MRKHVGTAAVLLLSHAAAEGQAPRIEWLSRDGVSHFHASTSASAGPPEFSCHVAYVNSEQYCDAICRQRMEICEKRTTKPIKQFQAAEEQISESRALPDRDVTVTSRANQLTVLEDDAIRSTSAIEGQFVNRATWVPGNRTVANSSGLVYFRVGPDAVEFDLVGKMLWPQEARVRGSTFIQLFAIPNTGAGGNAFVYDSIMPGRTSELRNGGLMLPGAYWLRWTVDGDAMSGDARASLDFTLKFRARACSESGPDSDGDGLFDGWELWGIRLTNGRCVPRELIFDLNGDGQLDANEAPDPEVRDLYAEIDAMDGEQASAAAIARVVAAFETAPASSIRTAPVKWPAHLGPRPLPLKGIRLHVLRDTEILPQAHCVNFLNDAQRKGSVNALNAAKKGCSNELSQEHTEAAGSAGPASLSPRAVPANIVVMDFDDIKEAHFGTAAQRARPASAGAPSASEVREARAKVFRYALVVDHILDTGTAPPGTAEIGGDDVLVAHGKLRHLRAVALHGPTPSAPQKRAYSPYDETSQQAVTLMHELGHTLGLRHGGADDVLCKPNYLSIMNYSYALLASMTAGGITDSLGRDMRAPLDFSRSTLPGLNESQLVEANGVHGGGAGTALKDWPVIFGPVSPRSNPFTGASADMPQFGIASDRRGVDWNGDGDFSDTVQRNVNLILYGPVFGCKAQVARDPAQYLVGFDDWANLDFNFRDGGSFPDRARPAQKSWLR